MQMVADQENTVNYYPNPNNGSFNIDVTCAGSGMISITLSDLSGRVVKEIYNNTLPIGTNSIIVEKNADLSAGAYILKIRGGFINESKKVIIH